MKFPSMLSLPVIVCKLGKPVTRLRRELFEMMKSSPMLSRLGRERLVRSCEFEITRAPPMLLRCGSEILARDVEFEIRIDPPILLTFGRKTRARPWLFVMLK